MGMPLWGPRLVLLTLIRPILFDDAFGNTI
ncbi:hypothetical protein BJY27_004905 [Streptomyces rapamycinicus]|uniref:Uncharacterized protein n=2 Tax=Streptomyces rapamycinicus TaxID=1226757 RepID=A0A3L8RM75_STRRN|nr:hypothetical protein [Streptomyces rapamycinicus]RLV80568.1 hypothetical protein D3C57_119325 [Streptomyces rapamycinicus NRRL 5491]